MFQEKVLSDKPPAGLGIQNPDSTVMNRPILAMRLLSGRFAVARLNPDAPFPDWIDGGPLASVTRTRHEMSIVCLESSVPEGVWAERGFRALEVEGPLDFALTGIVAALTNPLAEVGISVFVISTFDTDYLMVREPLLAKTVATLRDAGHEVEGSASPKTAGPV